MPAKNRVTRTIQFGVRDVYCYRNRLIIPNTSHVSLLEQTNVVTLCISNQKNGTSGETVYQHTLSSSMICPVKALAWHVLEVMSHFCNDVSSPLSLLASTKAPTGHATAAMVCVQVRKAVKTQPALTGHSCQSSVLPFAACRRCDVNEAQRL